MNKTYKLTIQKSDGTYIDTATFTIPSTPGTYRLDLTLSNGNTITAGNIEVGLNPKTYRLDLTLSNGNIITAGSFTTPLCVGWHNRITDALEFVAGTGKSYNITRADVNGWADTASTRITGYLAVDTADTNFPRQDFTEETITSTTKSVVNYVDSGKVGSIRFTYTMKTDIKLVNGATNIIEIPTVIITDYSSRFGTTDVPGKLYITKIEQYY